MSDKRNSSVRASQVPATSGRSPGSSDQDQTALWPFTPRAAILLTPLLLIVLVAGAATLRSVSDWPGTNSDNLLLGAVVVLGLLPLALLLVDSVASRGGSVGFRDIQVSFAATTPDKTQATMSVNLGAPLPGVTLMDSGRIPVLASLLAMTTSELAVIDLDEEGGWWPTRLFALSAGATRQGMPHTIAFVSGRDVHRFEGYVSSSKLREAFLSARADFRHVFIRAERITRKLQLVEPTGVNLPPPLLEDAELLGPDLQDLIAEVFPIGTDEVDPQVFERVLLKLLAPLETNPPQVPISPNELNRLFAYVLWKGQVDRTSSSAVQLEEVLMSGGPYVAISERDAFKGLKERSSILQEIVRDVVRSVERA
jgi:hypothetical protein